MKKNSALKRVKTFFKLKRNKLPNGGQAGPSSDVNCLQVATLISNPTIQVGRVEIHCSTSTAAIDASSAKISNSIAQAGQELCTAIEHSSTDISNSIQGVSNSIHELCTAIEDSSTNFCTTFRNISNEINATIRTFIDTLRFISQMMVLSTIVLSVGIVAGALLLAFPIIKPYRMWNTEYDHLDNVHCSKNAWNAGSLVDVEDVDALLIRLKLTIYAELFSKEAIDDLDTLAMITESDLKEMGVDFCSRRKLMGAIRNLREIRRRSK